MKVETKRQNSKIKSTFLSMLSIVNELSPFWFPKSSLWILEKLNVNKFNWLVKFQYIYIEN
jgi:hypothetical protein